MQISQKQNEAILALPGPKRYSLFVKVVADTGTAWGLWKDGWAMASTDEEEATFPLWPAKMYAEMCAIGEWEGYEARVIEAEDLLTKLLPMLEREGGLPAIFMTTRSKAVTPTVEFLSNDLREELGRD